MPTGGCKQQADRRRWIFQAVFSQILGCPKQKGKTLRDGQMLNQRKHHQWLFLTTLGYYKNIIIKEKKHMNMLPVDVIFAFRKIITLHQYTIIPKKNTFGSQKNLVTIGGTSQASSTSNWHASSAACSLWHRRCRVHYGVVLCVKCNTVDGRNPAPGCIEKPLNSGIFSISTGAGFLPSTGGLLCFMGHRFLMFLPTHLKKSSKKAPIQI